MIATRGAAGRVRRLERLALIALAMAVVVSGAAPVAAQADDPGYGTDVFGPVLRRQQLQRGPSGATSTDRPAAAPNVSPAAKPPGIAKAPPAVRPSRQRRKFQVRCHGKRTRICTFYKNRRSYKRCTKTRRQRTFRCRRYTRGRLVLRSTRPGPRARIAAITENGYANPVVPQVGRFYYSGANSPNNGWCSGTLILRGVVLTAAHCIHANGLDRAPDGSANHYYDPRAFTFTPANTADPSNPVTGRTAYGNWSVRNMWAHRGWQQNDQTRDWALVLLNPDASGRYPGDATGTFPVYYGLRLRVGQAMQAIGYPSSQLFGTSPFFFGNGQYYVSSTINFGQVCAYPTLCGSSFVHYDSVMTGGSSGGPVFYLDSDGQYKLSGVVNRGLTRCECDNPPQSDYGLFQLTGYLDASFREFYDDVINQINSGA